MHNEPDLDQIVDSALAAYTAQEPQVGMEARVLRAARAPRLNRWVWVGVPALAGAAAALFLALQPAPPVPPRAATARLEAQTSAIGMHQMKADTKPVPKPRGLSHQPLIAPSEPLTTQQLALQVFVVKYPEQAARMVRVVPAELSLEPLVVEPLSISSLDQ